MNKRKLTTLLSLGCVVVAAGALYIYQKEVNKPVKVLEFTRQLQANTPITAQDLKIVEIPKPALVGRPYITNPDMLKGKVTSVKIFPNELVTVNKVVSESQKNPFLSMDLSGYRMISIPVSYADTFGGNIKAGEKVDLSYTSQVSGIKNSLGKPTTGTYVKTFLQNVLVYSVSTADGQPYVHGAAPQATGPNGQQQQQRPQPPAIATLAVPAQQADMLLARLSTGKIQIVGRFDKSVNVNTQSSLIYQSGTGQVVVTNSNIEVK